MKNNKKSTNKRTRVRDAIAKRGDLYYVVLREPDPLTGKSKPVWTSGFSSRESAKAYRDQRRQELRDKRAVPKSGMTVGEYLSEWLPGHVATKQLKTSTAESYREHIDNYIVPNIGQIRLQDLTAAQVDNLYQHLLVGGGRQGRPLSPRMVQLTGTILRMALKKAVHVYRYLPSSPAEHVTLPQPRKKPVETWNAKEMDAILAATLAHPFGAFFFLAASTGARRGELLALRWSDVDLAQGTITFRHNRVALRGSVEEGTLKNDQTKVVPIDRATVAALTEHRRSQVSTRLASRAWASEDYVFTNRAGEPLHPRTANRIWSKIVEAAGVPYRKPHALRHTHATVLLEAGLPLHVVADRLGHKDAMVTATVYAHVTPKQSAEAAEAFTGWLHQEDEDQAAQ